MNIKVLSACLAIVSPFFVNTGVAADASCKGLVENGCANASSCRWVQSYKRTDGREVNGYCRTLPKKTANPKVSKLD